MHSTKTFAIVAALLALTGCAVSPTGATTEAGPAVTVQAHTPDASLTPPTAPSPTPPASLAPSSPRPERESAAAPTAETAEPVAEVAVAPPPAVDDGRILVGDSGPAVLAVQQRLAELGYWTGTPDGDYGPTTSQAVLALQKAAGLSRDGVLGPQTLAALDAGTRPQARTAGSAVELDLDRQLLLVVRDGEVLLTLNTSTGKVGEFDTPRGEFTVQRVIDGMRVAPLGELWRPRYFNSGIAVHGSPSIPAYAASHGCARLSNAAIDMIWAEDLMPIGSVVSVY